jgi:hypothetical protein
VNKWIKNYGSFGGNNETIALGSSELKVRWLSTDSELRSMILIDSGYFPIVQKYGGQAKKPSGINTIEEYSSFSDGNKLICTFGEYDEQDDEKDEFDFVYRTVFSTRQLNEYSASVIKMPDTLELEG